jgi:hypothetical protein
MTKFSRSKVEGFKTLEQLENTEPGFKLPPRIPKGEGADAGNGQGEHAAPRAGEARAGVGRRGAGTVWPGLKPQPATDRFQGRCIVCRGDT